MSGRTATFRLAPGSLFMEYKGVEYQVVQTTDPTGWKWTVELGREQTRTGSGRSRTAAIGLAQITIDEAIKKGSPINSTGLIAQARMRAVLRHSQTNARTSRMIVLTASDNSRSPQLAMIFS